MFINPALTGPLAAEPNHAWWPPAGHQWLPVSGFIPYRFLATYRAPARALTALLPMGLELDVHAGCGFLSVCALQVRGMGLAKAPSFLRFDNEEFLYRLAVRHRGEPTFVTLRSDVSSRSLAILGRYFSHYRPRRARFSSWGRGSRRRLECSAADPLAHAVLEVDSLPDYAPAASIFDGARAASEFLLGMRFSTDVSPTGRVQVQEIEHSPWNPSYVKPLAVRFAFVDHVSRELGCELTLDHVLGMANIRQLWRAAKWL